MARFNKGYIRLYRKIDDHNFNATHLAVWVQLLLWANRFESKVRKSKSWRTLPPGSLVVGMRNLAERLELSKSTIQRTLTSLENAGCIKRESGTLGTVITICNWESYQSDESNAGTEVGHERDTSGTRAGHERALNGESRNKNKEYISRIRAQDIEDVYKEFYPRRIGKTKGIQSAKNQIKTKEDLEKLRLAMRRYRDECKIKQTEERFIMHFSTFMSKGRWKDFLDDDYGQVPTKASNNQKPFHELKQELEERGFA